MTHAAYKHEFQINKKVSEGKINQVVLMSVVQSSPITKVEASLSAKKRKACLRKIHIDLEETTFIDLEKGNLLEGGVISYSR